MRIAIVNKYLHVTGGADRHCRGLAEILEERGHEVVFLTTEGADAPDRAAVTIPTSVTHDSRATLSPAEQARAAARSLWNPDAAAAMRRLIAEYRPDVVHAHKLYPQLSVAPLVEAARARIPIVQTLHDFELIAASALDARGGWRDLDETRLRYRLLNSTTLPIRRRVYRPLVRAFVSVSRYIARVYGAHGIRSTVLPNFLPSAQRPTRLTSFAQREGIVFVGRLQPEKGVADVLALAQRLPEVPVTIIGTGELDAPVAEHASRLDNLAATGFLGADAVAAHMSAARLLVIPSRWQEPGPLTPLEAMALGTPVVAFANGGLAEYVADAGAGRVVPGDAESLVAACAELYGDGDTWSKLSRAALAAVEERHSRSGYGEKIERVYRALV